MFGILFLSPISFGLTSSHENEVIDNRIREKLYISDIFDLVVVEQSERWKRKEPQCPHSPGMSIYIYIPIAIFNSESRFHL